ncbi:GNAT family N-acetyltransferase [Lysinibacillus capsici]
MQLHKKMGFRIVGTREKIAQLDGIWHDTVLMERRM